MPDWITPEDVASYLDDPTVSVAPEDNLALSTAAWRAAVERRHPRYFDDDDPPVYSAPADIRLGAIRAAAMTFQARATTSTGDEGSLWDSLGANRSEIMRQLRWNVPVAR
jgi:hypothetical protein